MLVSSSDECSGMTCAPRIIAGIIVLLIEMIGNSRDSHREAEDAKCMGWRSYSQQISAMHHSQTASFPLSRKAE